MVWDNERPSYMLEDRLKQGIELYEIGASDRIIMSGDHGQKDYDEVNIMKQYAVDFGVPSEKIFMDHAGFSTYESIYRARDIREVLARVKDFFNVMIEPEPTYLGDIIPVSGNGDVTNDN